MESQQLLDFESSRLWWIVALLELVNDQLLVQYWHSQFLSLDQNSITARLLHLIVPSFVSTLLKFVGILRIDLQHDDDNIEVHSSTKRVPLLCECFAASSLP